MAERANNQQLGGGNSVVDAQFLAWADALKADLAAVDPDGLRCRRCLIWWLNSMLCVGR
jgi:hypothetical protein